MADITGYVSELAELDHELKRLRKETRKLNLRKVEVETKIQKFLHEKDLPGVKDKYKGVAVIAEDSKRRERKNKEDKFLDGRAVLRDHGVENTKEVLDELLEAMRGAPYQSTKLKIKKLTN